MMSLEFVEMPVDVKRDGEWSGQIAMQKSSTKAAPMMFGGIFEQGKSQFATRFSQTPCACHAPVYPIW